LIDFEQRGLCARIRADCDHVVTTLRLGLAVAGSTAALFMDDPLFFVSIIVAVPAS
jgi:hypothetical protein